MDNRIIAKASFIGGLAAIIATTAARAQQAPSCEQTRQASVAVAMTAGNSREAMDSLRAQSDTAYSRCSCDAINQEKIVIAASRPMTQREIDSYNERYENCLHAKVSEAVRRRRAQEPAMQQAQSRELAPPGRSYSPKVQEGFSEGFFPRGFLTGAASYGWSYDDHRPSSSLLATSSGTGFFGRASIGNSRTSTSYEVNAEYGHTVGAMRINDRANVTPLRDSRYVALTYMRGDVRVFIKTQKSPLGVLLGAGYTQNDVAIGRSIGPDSTASWYETTGHFGFGAYLSSQHDAFGWLGFVGSRSSDMEQDHPYMIPGLEIGFSYSNLPVKMLGALSIDINASYGKAKRDASYTSTGISEYLDRFEGALNVQCYPLAILGLGLRVTMLESSTYGNPATSWSRTSVRLEPSINLRLH